MIAHPVGHRAIGYLTVLLQEPKVPWLRPCCSLTKGGRSHLKPGKTQKKLKRIVLVRSLKTVDNVRETQHPTPLLLPKANNWTLFTDVALGLMFCCFCSCHAMQNWQPYHRLWLQSHPIYKLLYSYFWLIVVLWRETKNMFKLKTKTNQQNQNQNKSKKTTTHHMQLKEKTCVNPFHAKLM